MGSRRLLAATAAFLLTVPLGALVASGPAYADPGDVTRISYGPGGEVFDRPGLARDVNRDGSVQLVSGGTPSATQPAFHAMFVRQGGATVEVPFTHLQQIGSLSDSGQYVAYVSTFALGTAPPGDDYHLYRYAWETGQIDYLEGLGDDAWGSPCSAPEISDDGLTVAFTTRAPLVAADVNEWCDVYLWREGLPLTLVTDSGTATMDDNHDASRIYTLTPDGAQLLFGSKDRGLVPGDTTVPHFHALFLYDVATGALTLESRYDDTGDPLLNGVHGADLTDDGNTIVFSSASDPTRELGEVWLTSYLHDRSTGTTTRIGSTANGGPMFAHVPSVDATGRFVAMEADWDSYRSRPLDPLGYAQVLIWDADSGLMQLASHLPGDPEAEAEKGGQNPVLSSDGSTVVFTSHSTDLDAVSGGVPAAFKYEVTGGADPDQDGDGIDDVVDADGGDGSAPGGFADDVVSGTITLVPSGFGVTVTDAVDPADGVRVQVTGTGLARVRLTVCGFVTSLSAGSDVVLTCGSVIADVAVGDVIIELGGGAFVTVPAGSSAEVGEEPGGGYAVTVLTDGPDPVTLTVDGATSELPAGTTHAEAWDFVGFSAPVDAPPVVNTVLAGAAVPLKWRLLDAAGRPVTDLSAATVTFVASPCSAGAKYDAIEQITLLASSLKNKGNGYYTLNWRTPRTHRTCGQMRLDLGDGVLHVALFRLV